MTLDKLNDGTSYRLYGLCQCGCGEVIRNQFAQGHDARHKSVLNKLAASGDKAAVQELKDRGW